MELTSSQSQNYFIFYHYKYNTHYSYFPFRRIYHTNIFVLGGTNESTIPTGNKMSRETVHKSFQEVANAFVV
jgi:hypothetical protein